MFQNTKRPPSMPDPRLLAKIALASAWTGSLATVAMTSVGLGIWAGDHVMPRVWVTVLLKIFGIRVIARGAEALDPDGQYVFVSNHGSVLDGLALVVTTRRMPRFVGKDSIRKIPVVGQAWERLGHVLIDRKDPAQAYAALAQAARNDRDDYSFYVAPEGTRFNQGVVGDFKRGAFFLARQLHVPVIPVAIVGADRLWPAGTWQIKAGDVTIHYGPPMMVDNIEESAIAARRWIESIVDA